MALASRISARNKLLVLVLAVLIAPFFVHGIALANYGEDQAVANCAGGTLVNGTWYPYNRTGANWFSNQGVSSDKVIVDKYGEADVSVTFYTKLLNCTGLAPSGDGAYLDLISSSIDKNVSPQAQDNFLFRNNPPAVQWAWGDTASATVTFKRDWLISAAAGCNQAAPLTDVWTGQFEGGSQSPIRINACTISVSGWTLNATSRVNPTSVYPGQSVAFVHTINNNGPASATFKYTVHYQYDQGTTGDVYSAKDVNNLGAYNSSTKLPVESKPHSFVMPSTSASKYCEWVEYNPTGLTNAASSTSTKACVSIIKPSPVCSAGLGITSGTPDVNEKFSVNPYVTYENAQAVNAAINVTQGKFYVKIVNSANSVVYDSGLFNGTVNGAQYIGALNDVGPINTGGTYTVKFGVIGGTGAIGCTSTITIAYHPYFIALGGDLVAGGSYLSGTTCTQNPSAVIRSWNNDSFPYFGAATELAAFALGDISHFATATDPATGNSTVGQSNNLNSNLAFANKTSPLGQLGSIACMPDYYAAASLQPTKTPTGNLSDWASGVYKVTGNYSMAAVSLKANGQNVVLLVAGNVYINGDIKYNAAPSVAKIPRLTIITKGNIYIDNDVKELHGAYIAEPNGASGSGAVYTCAVISGTNVDLNNDYNNCNKQLSVYGSISAQSLKIGRSFGTLSSKIPAETFQYTPELWLGGTKGMTDSVIKYDSITSLPPTL